MTDLVRVTEVLSRWNPYHNEEAMERGGLVHFYTHVYADKTLAIVPTERSIYVEGYVTSFRTWFDKYVDSVIWVEQRFADEKLGITGQPDILFKFKGKKFLSLGDYKTGTPTKSWPIQLAPYKRLVEAAGYSAGECGNIMLHENGKIATWRPMEIPENQAWWIFLGALNCYRYFQNKKGERND